MNELYDESMNVKCFLCDHLFKSEEESWMIFNGYFINNNQLKLSLSNILSTALGLRIEEKSAHSIFLCTECKTLTLEYRNIEEQLDKLRSDIVTAYNHTAVINGLMPICDNIKDELQESFNGADNIKSVDTSDNVEKLIFSHIKEMEDEEFLYQNVNDKSIEGNTFSKNKKNIEEIDALPLEIYSNNSEPIIKAEEIDIEEEEFTSWNMEENTENLALSHENSKSFDNSKNHREKSDLLQNNERTKEIEFDYITTIRSTYKCEKCYKLFATFSTLKHHMKMHNERILNENQSTPLKDNGSTSKEIHKDTTGVYKCSKCEKTYTSLSSFTYHMELHSEILYECDICKINFLHKKLLIKHTMIHMNETMKPVYECDVCHKKFFGKKNLKQHKIIHSSEILYSCKLCNKAFKFKQSLEVHKGIHVPLNEYKFQCKKCDKKYFTKKELTRHEIKHTNKFDCDICQQGFFHKTNLDLHKDAVHRGIKKFKCKVCGKSYPYQSSLDIHISTHSAEYAFICSICKLSFRDKSRLYVHISQDHKTSNKST